ncbi:ferritin-like domain-containing protein [Thalassobacillus hwangdonensis]|uniref:Ferritin-like domain-containing protein n=1 Tax=Thalassobacillus hwangdonensis TaxID=546108 RepID=A0ABW3L474_9BACI
MSYYYYYPTDTRQQDKLIQDIQKAINGEFSAIQCYSQLIDLAPTKAEKDRIREIRKDERRHLQTFSQIYTSLTGRQPDPQQTEECPRTYRRGLEAAFRDEQETADFYQDIADEAAMYPVVSQSFRRAAADEQNHAVWFLSFIMQNKREE